jgi:hypothetical protein
MRKATTPAPDAAGPDPKADLASLLESAKAAPPERRIEWRDAIAAHGAAAIEGVRPWLADAGLAAFAVRVIERAGVDGEGELAARVLRASRARIPENVAGDVEWALQRLRDAAKPKPAATATPARPATRAAAPSTRSGLSPAARATANARRAAR